MSIIVSVVPKWRFDAVGATVPETWEMVFVDAEDDVALREACKGADVLLAPSGFQKVTADLLRRNPHLKLVQASGAGFDGVDLATARELGIPVANVPGANAHDVAEYTIGLMIAMQRALIVADRETKAGQYSKVRKQMFLRGLGDMPGSTIGLVGLGAIGRRVAEIARFLGAKVVYYNRTRLAPAQENDLGIEYRSLPELLAQSDIVSLHIPLTSPSRDRIPASIPGCGVVDAGVGFWPVSGELAALPATAGIFAGRTDSLLAGTAGSIAGAAGIGGNRTGGPAIAG